MRPTRIPFGPLSSVSEIRWLETIETIEQIKLERNSSTKNSTGQKCIDKRFHVDGYDRKNKVAYEFLGCTWHGFEAHTLNYNKCNRWPSKKLNSELWHNTTTRFDTLLQSDEIKEIRYISDHEFNTKRNCILYKKYINNKLI